MKENKVKKSFGTSNGEGDCNEIITEKQMTCSHDWYIQVTTKKAWFFPIKVPKYTKRCRKCGIDGTYIIDLTK